MGSPLKSSREQVDSYVDAVELYFRNGWSDGLPVVPPTEKRVLEFLDYAGLEPDQVLGEIPERARSITAEKMAINAVMAGCLPEYMPVLVAAVEAVTDPQYRFNHLASLGSPWPIIVVNGPIIREINLHTGIYPFGPGSRPNATIARALSLLLRNCAEAKAEGVQRGQWGNSLRWGGCIAENEETPWTPLHVQRGFDRDTSTVTVLSCYPGAPYHCSTWLGKPKQMLDTVCYALPNVTGGQWAVGTYTALIGPHHVELFHKEGWSKEDVHDYLVNNAKISVAALKTRGTWGARWQGFTEKMLEIQPGDESRYMYLLKDNGEYQQYLALRTGMEGRLLDIFVVVAGGNAGHRIALTAPYSASTNPVTKAIRVRY